MRNYQWRKRLSNETKEYLVKWPEFRESCRFLNKQDLLEPKPFGARLLKVEKFANTSDWVDALETQGIELHGDNNNDYLGDHDWSFVEKVVWQITASEISLRCVEDIVFIHRNQFFFGCPETPP